MRNADAVTRACLILVWLACLGQAAPPPRPYHVIRYDLTIQPSLPERIIRGLVTLEISAGQANLTSIELDAAEMTILACNNGKKLLRYVKTNDLLTVTLSHPLRENQKTQLTIRYQASPRTGVRFFPDQMYTVFATSHWLPCNDRPSDRAVYTMRMVAPAGLTAVASGDLTDTRQENGQNVTTWRVEHPIPTYVFGWALGEFTTFKDDSAKGTPDGGLGTLRYLTSVSVNLPPSPPADKTPTEKSAGNASGADSAPEPPSKAAAIASELQKEQNKKLFSITRAAAQFFADKSGEAYPAKSYTEIFARGDVAQEASQVTLLSSSYLEDLIKSPTDVWLLAHELAHQWWGISVTCEDWSDFWLNEGIATYMADAFLEQEYGKVRYEKEIEQSHEIYRQFLIQDQDRPLSYHGWQIPSQAGGRLPYHKGAWFLHLLRQQIGDDQFWRGMRQYTRRNWRRSVTSRTFQSFFEQACNCTLQNLFNEYVYAL